MENVVVPLAAEHDVRPGVELADGRPEPVVAAAALEVGQVETGYPAGGVVDARKL